MEALVRLCRALANHERLALVRLLALSGEQPVTDIAKALGIRQPNTSNHLRILAANGVLWQRRSGTYVYYGIAKSKVDRRQGVIQLLVLTLRQKRRGSRDLAAIAHWAEAEGECPADGEIFASLTAFTHPRRLQLLRWLVTHGPRPRSSLTGALNMSGNACDRHLEKLLRRGVVVRRLTRNGYEYAVNTASGNRFGAQLLRNVLAWLKSMEDSSN